MSDRVSIVVEPVEIGKDSYYTVSQFAAIISKSEQTVYNLLKNGNSIRKMKSVKLAGRPLIPCSELMEFPFTFAGCRAKDHIYHYNKKGKVVVEKGGDKK